MGLLDDAIRDHLDLKRRRGADPGEIARLEHEALGPVRREPFGRDEQESGTRAGVAPTDEREAEVSEAELQEFYEEEYYEEEGAQWEEPFAEGEEPSIDRQRSRSRTSEPSDIEPPSTEQTGRGSRGWRRFRRANVPPEEAPPTHASPPETAEDRAAGEETVEYEVDDAIRSPSRSSEDEPASGEGLTDDEGDVLEETPEFLQDAPGHDQLWSEQRPPRDFDFDD
ncbi:MAG: hypothetical protein JO321_14440 [Solirubrobacterales bacterium]|nr:hypothetical protein [Solirubrobacterales bacterium]MBV9166775.1 hypothetical protein [Solirubrobacterales bacterium]MBV9536600.1 hypothetical protein [Solirubrobacterales bacterium]